MAKGTKGPAVPKAKKDHTILVCRPGKKFQVRDGDLGQVTYGHGDKFPAGPVFQVTDERAERILAGQSDVVMTLKRYKASLEMGEAGLGLEAENRSLRSELSAAIARAEDAEKLVAQQAEIMETLRAASDVAETETETETKTEAETGDEAKSGSD